MVRVLIIGTGGMANAHAEAYAKMEGVQLVAGIDTNKANLDEFCDRHGVENRFVSIADALNWGAFDAVSNVTPDAIHCATSLQFIAAGKHVLCEKPLATNWADADRMAAAAREAGIVNVVNLSYRSVPALAKAAQMVADGLIGEVRHFEASYLQSWLTQDAWGDWATESQWLWRLSTAHGSMGVLGDVGVHILDFATHIAGLPTTSVSCRLTTFDKAPGGQIGDYVLDANDSFNMTLTLANGAAGVVHASRMATGHHNDLSLRIFGTKGGLEVLWQNDVSILRACLGDDIGTPTWRDVQTEAVASNYEVFIGAVRGDCAATPDFARGADLQKVLDRAVDSDAQRSIDLPV